MLNPSRAVPLCVDLALHTLSDSGPPPDTMGEVFDRLNHSHQLDASLALRLCKAVGFRNLAVHNYTAIDWAIVHAIATRHRGDFSDFAQWVAARTR